MEDHLVTRRALLLAAGGAALAGCQAGSSPTPTPGTTAATTAPTITGPTTTGSTTAATTTSAPTMTGPTTRAPTTAPANPSAGPSDFAALAKGLSGTLVLPHDSGYAQASEIFNPRFDGIHPQAVAQCASAADVAECVAFARHYAIDVAVRSGGHCYEGWSVGPGLVIDTGPINHVAAESGTATVGAGARLIDVYATLADGGVGIPGGSCPTVGITGLTLGGGIGVIGRNWGLACDNLVSAEIVTADGKTVTCGPSADADLFWACQGGAGGTFGVVTSLTFRTRPTAPVATWVRSWPWSRVDAVINAWMGWARDAPGELWGSVHLSSAPGSSTPSVSVVGTYFGGDVSALDQVLTGLVSAVGSEPSSHSGASHSFIDAMLIDAGCGSKGLTACHLEPAGSVARQAYAGSSDWINKPMSSAGVSTMVNAIQKRHDTPNVPDVAIQLDAAGGAINRVQPGATAFVHRQAICSVQYIANWYDSTSAAAVKSAAAWPHATRQAMQPYVSGEAYQNYVDGQITDWAQAYFGANYRRLQQVKAKYDPGNLFHHPQSVSAG